MTDRTSNALLSIASNSLNLTEILNAQQQALEQFQCQLQLAQQTEAINQRLDAIERTLNSLIQQKAQEDAVKTHHHQQQQVVVEQQPAPPGQEAEDLQAQAQVHLTASLTPVRPSQQIQMLSDSLGPAESKKKKLPRELCVRGLVYDVIVA
jgi:predicted ribosome quality control (RQC) complex YloA/Tae2 family protein